MTSPNPYQGPTDQTETAPLPQKEASLAKLIKRGFFSGLLTGFVAGAVAAVAISLLAEYGFLYTNPTQTDYARIDPITNFLLATAALFTVALIGGLFGGTGCSIFGAASAWFSSYLRADFRKPLLFATACSCGLVGSIGGAALGFLMSGAGHDGEPILWKAIVLASLIGTACGLAGGVIHGSAFGNYAWGPRTVGRPKS